MHNGNGYKPAKTPKQLYAELPGTIPDQLQPDNVEAEESVIGSLLIDPDAIIKVPFLKPCHFFIIRLGWIFQAILDLADSSTPADIVTLADELARRNQLEEIGGPAYLTSLLTITPSSLNIEHYARIVERDAVRRRLIDGAGQIARLAFDHQGEADELLAQSEKIVSDIANSRLQTGRAASLAEIVSEIHDDVDKLQAAGGQAVLGLPTGLSKLDKALGGLQRSDLIVIGGRPGMGKSALAIQIAIHAAKKLGARSLVFSLEMNRKQVARRTISSESGIEENRIKSADIKPDEWTAYINASDEIARLPITINDAAIWTPRQLRAEIIRHSAKNGLDLIVLDYLQLMAGDDNGWQSNRHQEVSGISRMCKIIARDLDIPFIAISQLSRRCEERGDKRPMLSDLRESGAIEADADIVIFVYRDEVYNKDAAPGVTEAIIAKHRAGPTGTVNLYFKANVTKFFDLETRRLSLDSVDF